MQDGEMSLIEHLTELRRRVIWVLVVLVIMMIFGLLVASEVLDYLKSIPPANGMDLHAFSPWSGIKVYMQLSFVIAFLVTLPIILYHLWAFVRPGLHKEENRAAARYIPFSLLLCMIGLVFAYFVVFRMALYFSMTINNRLLLTETYGITEYFSFMLNIILPVAILFELPVVVMFLTRLRILNPMRLRKLRRYAYLILVIAGVFISPPDLISDLLIAIPLIVLYEFSVFLSSIVYRKQQKMEIILSKQDSPAFEADSPAS